MKLSEDGADQWELLQTVHQLFSRPLKCYSDTKNVGSAENLREERLQNYKDFFQVDVKMLLLNVQPDCELSTQAFQTCIDSLNDLLEAFENLIDDSILDIQDKKFQDPLQETSRANLEKEKTKLSKIFRGRFSHRPDHHSQLASQAMSQAPSALPSPSCVLHPNAKLRSVKETLYRDDGDLALLDKCVQLQKEEEFATMLNVISSFNGTMRQLFKQTPALLDNSSAIQTTLPTKETKVPENSPGYAAWSLMENLHASFIDHLTYCESAHQARLHVPVLQKSDNVVFTLDVDIFFSTCQQSNKWHEAKCKVSSSSEHGPFPGQTEIHNLCDSISRSHKLRRVLHLLADEQRLWDSSRSPRKLMAAKAFPGISLRALLENGHFGQTRKKGLTKISLKEKRIFAVILAHTMLQLCGGPWIQETWDAENIFFMFDPETQKLFDFYRPYIASPLESDQLADVSCDDRMHKYPLILDFARILLEIEYGETIKATEEDYDAETHKETQDTPFFMIDRVLNEIADDVYQDYRNAISACLDIEKFLPHGGFFDDPEFQQSIYKYIVAPLEDELFKAFKLKADELYLMNRYEDTATHNRATINIWSVTETPLQDNQLKVPPMVSGSTHVENTTLESSGSIVIRESQTTPSISSTTTYTPDSYTVAIVCPMGIEMAPVVALLDKDHPDLSFTRRTNTYTLGQIGEHNVVITVMPEIGNSRAASVVTQLQNDFQSLQFGLLVGIGGGIPDLNKNDIRLGDVVVSKPTGAFGGVVQFDRGKTNVDNRFERTGSLNKPPQFLMASLEKLSAQHRIKGNQISHNLSIMLKRCPQMAVEKYIHQGEENNVLFKHTYMHKSSSNCKDCREDNVVERPPRRSTSPVVHYGTIGSANTVVKDANTREKLKQDLGIICVEMEAAGLMDEFPCLVIRGICDYADSHKNKMWQPYAASTAAAFAKELLSVIPA